MNQANKSMAPKTRGGWLTQLCPDKGHASACKGKQPCALSIAKVCAFLSHEGKEAGAVAGCVRVDQRPGMPAKLQTAWQTQKRHMEEGRTA
jgi:hypothetical protein